jgi:hypothetical protein
MRHVTKNYQFPNPKHRQNKYWKLNMYTLEYMYTKVRLLYVHTYTFTHVPMLECVIWYGFSHLRIRVLRASHHPLSRALHRWCDRRHTETESPSGGGGGGGRECVFVCVCVCEREREKRRGECACVCVCACVITETQHLIREKRKLRKERNETGE